MLFWSDCWLDSGGATFFSFSLDSVFNFFSLIYGDHIILARCQRSLGSGDDGLDKSDFFFIFEKENIRASDEENDSSAVDQLKTSIFWWDEKVQKSISNVKIFRDKKSLEQTKYFDFLCHFRGYLYFLMNLQIILFGHTV